MDTHPGIIEGTAKEIRNELAHIPDDEIVRLVIGRPSLSLIARKLQAEAAANGMTTAIHDELLSSLKDDR
jgi:hypothetical protein